MHNDDCMGRRGNKETTNKKCCPPTVQRAETEGRMTCATENVIIIKKLHYSRIFLWLRRRDVGPSSLNSLGLIHCAKRKQTFSTESVFFFGRDFDGLLFFFFLRFAVTNDIVFLSRAVFFRGKRNERILYKFHFSFFPPWASMTRCGKLPKFFLLLLVSHLTLCCCWSVTLKRLFYCVICSKIIVLSFACEEPK